MVPGDPAARCSLKSVRRNFPMTRGMSWYYSGVRTSQGLARHVMTMAWRARVMAWRVESRQVCNGRDLHGRAFAFLAGSQRPSWDLVLLGNPAVSAALSDSLSVRSSW
jgi:hypothetical protein